MLLDVELDNRSIFHVRVESLTAVFLALGAPVEEVVLGREFFKDPVFPRSARLDRDSVCRQ